MLLCCVMNDDKHCKQFRQILNTWSGKIGPVDLNAVQGKKRRISANQFSYTQEAVSVMDRLFNKNFCFEKDETWKLPTSAFKTEKWDIPALQQRKIKLNGVKCLLDDMDLATWSHHTKCCDPTGEVIHSLKRTCKPELLTQAWMKFYECLHYFPSIVSSNAVATEELTSMHLCEAPGAFISALNHYLKLTHPHLHWKWYANTLNPYYEGISLKQVIPDDRLIKYTYERWYFGLDFTGDIMKYYNHMDIVNKMRAKGEVWLVTADGSIDCIDDPGNQEITVAHLHFCETMTALAILKRGGTLVLKIFTMFEESSICLLYLLVNVFEEMKIYKPATSKRGNSETYLICLDYKGADQLEQLWPALMKYYKDGDSDKGMFDLNEISESFIKQLTCAIDYFIEMQMDAIQENIANFYDKTRLRNITSLKHKVKTYYFQRYNVQRIPNHLNLVPDCNIGKYNHLNLRNCVKFNNSIHKFSLHVPDLRDMVEITLGKRIEKLFSPLYCKRSSLDGFSTEKCKVSGGQLYHYIVNQVSTQCSVIALDSGKYSNEKFYSLQRLLFEEIHSCATNSFLLRVPCVTNFLAGLLFILIACYDEVVFHKFGFLIFHDNTTNSITKLKRNLDVIQKAFNSIDKSQLFECDIMQVLPCGFFSEDFIDFLYSYNDILVCQMNLYGIK